MPHVDSRVNKSVPAHWINTSNDLWGQEVTWYVVMLLFPGFTLHTWRRILGRSHENFLVDRFVLNFYSSQIMSYLCQKCKNKMGVTDFVLEIKHVENYLILKIQHGLQGFIVKKYRMWIKGGKWSSWIAPLPVVLKQRLSGPDLHTSSVTRTNINKRPSAVNAWFRGPSKKPGTWNIPEHSGTSRNIPKHCIVITIMRKICKIKFWKLK